MLTNAIFTSLPMEAIRSFMCGFNHMSRRHCIRKDKRLRNHMSERQIDKMVEDSFPASDPPSTY